MDHFESDTVRPSVGVIDQVTAKSAKPAASGLSIAPTFCPADVADVFGTVEWDLRTAAIKGENGEVVFEQRDCEIPASWSQLATNVVVNKYFYGEVNTPEREKGLRQLIHRVCRTIADWGRDDGYFAAPQDAENFYRDLAWLCLHQHASFNSPVWFNVGLYHQYGIKGAMCNWHWDAKTKKSIQPENPYEYPQASACFIQSVQDNMEDIMELARSEAMLFKFGSGTGTDLSTLRSHREKLSGGGKPSGPLSFMRVYDQIAAVVKSGGKTRRAAKMQSLKIGHPDVMEFIECKNREEKKARLLIQEGYDPLEAYDSILFQNANLSVRVTDEFMEAVVGDQPWTTHWVTAPDREGPTYPGREMFTRMAQAAWACGDPGFQYDTTINRWHTCPRSGRINASNPCVTGDTLVATSEGLQRIDSLIDRTPAVVGADGKLHHAKRVMRTGRKPVFRLRTCSGYELTLTEDHRVATVDHGDVAAVQLKGGERIRLGRVYFGEESLAPEEANELGRIIGRGEDNVNCALNRVLQRSACGFGSDASAVEVLDPPCENLLALDRDSAANVIRGCYSVQDYQSTLDIAARETVVELPHRSRDILRQLQLLLLGFGIKSRLEKYDGIPFRHALRIPREGRFDKLTRGELPDIEPDWSESDEIESLKWIGEEPVFDLTEPDTNHFVANGLVVHNCSEYMFIDDSACNLASINLMKFRQADGVFDVERFKAACRLVFIAQEILVDHASYPTARIAANSHRFRPIGLGYSNLGSLLMTGGLPYDSDEARGLCGAITALLHGTACRTSAELAAAVGPFDDYEENREPMLHVMEMHWEKVEQIKGCPAYLQEAARKLWDEVLVGGRRHGFRNAQATVLAPTGTISFMMDCDTTGIEPDIALVKYKQLAGGGMLKIVNQTVPLALRTLGYTPDEIESIVAYIDKHDTIEGATGLKPEHLPVFDCAFQPTHGTRSIPWKAHIRIMAAAQPFISGAISKTVNMPKDTTPEDVADAYMEGWRLGLKALAIYRDGSKEVQPVTTKKAEKVEKVLAAPRRERLPDTRQSITHKFNISGHEGYITVGLYPDGRPGELFITMAKEGSTIGGLMDCFGTAVSMSLQYGVPLEVYVNKFSHTRFEPWGYTKHPDIKIAKSIVDYIFRWLGITFLPGYREMNKAMPVAPAEASPGGSGDADSERRPVATKAGGPANGHGAVKTQASGGSPNGAGPKASLVAKVAPAAKSAAPARLAAAPQESISVQAARHEQFASFQADAPSCDRCGAITARAGNCYLCYNCGNSMGCS